MDDWENGSLPRKGPKFAALADIIEREITAGRMTAGSRLPPQRDIAARFDVTIATVTKGIAEAARRGLVTTRRGSGTFVAGGGETFPPADAPIDLGLNSLPTALVADLLGESIRAVARGRAATLLGYASYRSSREPVPGLSWLADHGVPPPPGAIALPTVGVQHGLVAAISILGRPGETALVEAQTYTGILRAARLRGLNPRGVPLDEEGMEPEALDRALSETGANLVVVTPTTQNPTGRTMGEPRRRAIAEICRRRGTFVVEDGIYAPFAPDPLPPIACLAPERVILLCGFSKCVAPGIRHGVMLVPERLREEAMEALVALAWLAPGLHAAIVTDLVDRGVMDEVLRRHRAEADARRALARRILWPGLGDGLAPSYHLWMDLPAPWTGDALASLAAACGIHVAPSGHFHADAEDAVQSRGRLRLCLGAVEDRARLAVGLERIATLLAAPPACAEPTGPVV